MRVERLVLGVVLVLTACAANFGETTEAEMADSYYNGAYDPFDSDSIPEYYHVQSAEFSGDFGDITVDSALNYPVNTPTRLFMYLPMLPYVDNLTTYPMTIKDVTTGVTLTRVSVTPSTNEYRVAPTGSKMATVIELNSGQLGHVIGFDYYAEGSILNAGQLNTTKFCATKITTMSLSDEPATITFDAVFDFNSEFSSNTFTAKSSGVYMFVATINFYNESSSNENYVTFNLLKNGSGIFDVAYVAPISTATYWPDQNAAVLNYIVELSIGDTISINAYSSEYAGDNLVDVVNRSFFGYKLV